MSKLNIFGEKLLQVVNQLTLNESSIREIENNALLSKASTFLQSMRTLIEGSGSIVLSKPDIENLYEVYGSDIKDVIDNGLDEIPVRWMYPDGTISGTGSLDADIVIDALTNEIEVANLTNNILAVVTSISNDSDYTTIANGLRAACANATTGAGASLSEFVNRALLGTNSPFELRKLMIQATFPEPSEETFAIPTIGQVTGTTGLALWFHSGVEKVSEIISSIKMDFEGVLSRAYNKYVESQTLNASLTATGFRSIGYQFSRLFTDPLIVPVKNYAHLGLNNSYIDLGFVTPGLNQALEHFGRGAIAIPTLGATWYLSFDDQERSWRLGMQKHLYDNSAAHRLHTLASQQSNTLKDVFACYATNGTSLEILDTGGSFKSLAEYNEYVYDSFRSTEKLISLGLLLLQSDDDVIRNRYYQDVDPDVRNMTNYRWCNMFNGSSVTVDPDIYTRKGLANASNSNSPATNSPYSFACLMLTNYFNNLKNNNGVCQHMYVNGTMIGYMNVADDAIVESQVSTRIQSVLITAVVFSSLLIASRAIVGIRHLALESQIAAQRLALNNNVSLAEARKAVTKAHRLSKIAGSATSFTTAIAASGMSDLGATINNKDELSEQLLGIKRLIKS